MNDPHHIPDPIRRGQMNARFEELVKTMRAEKWTPREAAFILLRAACYISYKVAIPAPFMEAFVARFYGEFAKQERKQGGRA